MTTHEARCTGISRFGNVERVLLAPIVVCSVLALVLSPAPPASPTWLTIATGPSLALVAIFFFRALWLKHRPRRLRATREGLFVDGRLELPRERIVRASVHHAQGRADLVVEHVGRKNLRHHFADAADAERLFDALEVSDAQRELNRFGFGIAPIELLVAIGLYAWFSISGVEWIGGLGRASSLVPMMVMMVLYAALVRGYDQALLGVDGIRLRFSLIKPFGRAERFVAYEDIVSLVAVRHALVLTLADGRALRMRFLTRAGREGAERAIERARGSRTNRAAAALPELARDGQPVSEWVARIKALGRGQTQRYRTPSPTEGTLRALIEHPTATSAMRVAAALALREAEGEAARADLVRTARSTGDALVERGLLRIADGASDEEIGELLERAQRQGGGSPTP